MASNPGMAAVAVTPLQVPGRRGRPTAPHVAAIEDEILDAAHALFLEFGYAAVSMEGISERAGISKGALYARYAGKEALFRAVIRKRSDIWSAEAGTQDHLMPRELGLRLIHHARMLVRMFARTKYCQTSQLIQTTAISFPDIAIYWQQNGARKYIDYLAADMASVEGPNRGDCPDWQFLAWLLLDGLSGWYGLEALLGAVSDERMDCFAGQLIETILAAIAAHENPL
ncbi:TetR/AcrR family transcriptional regulator [Novosphingobium sp. G106]|uniref:TetR/AcrR family transcriptional regulator n=1 Tax=Novosphingobium sp. G106 TaxID=2849500 RepID=UPI001C2D8E23|nr:TetR/AcrR family transcriptional regulator [Novosphingobium sp. G106]MBV1686340.1 TetR/AcrR family transcriptional regulator [Novosphingobium sp. G106]